MNFLKSILLVSLLLVAILANAQQKQKIIFDCDLGDDIDDAYALSMIISSDKFEVLGICRDRANAEERTRLASKLLYITGREDIPVFTGRNTSDKHITQYEWAEGFDKLGPRQKQASELKSYLSD